VREVRRVHIEAASEIDRFSICGKVECTRACPEETISAPRYVLGTESVV
jgi:hypothetical protein